MANVPLILRSRPRNVNFGSRAMAQVEVRIFKQGREIARVTRPLHQFNSRPVVKYKRQFWPLVNGCEVYLDDTAPADDARMADAAEPGAMEVAPRFEVVPPAQIVWDESQRDVIDAPP